LEARDGDPDLESGCAAGERVIVVGANRAVFLACAVVGTVETCILCGSQASISGLRYRTTYCELAS
jgi:hypothetical protein